ncbi:hypothetical protein FOZ63_012659, partial [Perkinsus olseni]
QLGSGMDTLLSSSELTPLGQVVGADLQVLSRIQSALYLHRKHVDREKEEERRLKDIHRASRGKPTVVALRSFLEGTVCLTTGLAVISMMSLLMGRKRKVVRLTQILRTLPAHARNALAVGVFMALYNGMVARARPSPSGSVSGSPPLSSPFFRGFVSTMCALPLAERSGRYFVALFVICRACEVLTVLGYANLPPRLRAIVDRICLGSPAAAAS